MPSPFDGPEIVECGYPGCGEIASVAPWLPREKWQTLMTYVCKNEHPTIVA